MCASRKGRFLLKIFFLAELPLGELMVRGKFCQNLPLKIDGQLRKFWQNLPLEK